MVTKLRRSAKALAAQAPPPTVAQMLETERQRAEFAVSSTVVDLVDKLRHLAEDCTRLADKLERSPESTVINGLGEIQGLAPRIDLLCARLSVERAHRDTLRAMVDGAATEAAATMVDAS